MVHALEEARRVVRAGGTLIDMRPVVSNPFVEVLSGEKVSLAGRVDDSADLDDVAASDQAIASAIERGWLQPHEQDSFPYGFYWETPREMFTYIEEEWPEMVVPDEVFSQTERLAEAAGPSCHLCIRWQVTINSYRVLQI